jgi:hypothetical protein
LNLKTTKPPLRDSSAPAPPSKPAIAEIAASALDAAAQALSAYTAAVKALEARVLQIEAKLEVLAIKSPAIVPSPATWMPTGIEFEKRSHVDTATAAHWLNRKPQTLRCWACLENGPLRPRRVGGRLAWAVADIPTILAASPS